MMTRRSWAPTVAAVFAVLLIAGCDKVKKPWPPREEMAEKGEGAILFKLTADAQLSEFAAQDLSVRWPRGAEENGDHLSRSQRVENPLGRESDRRPSDVVLVRLQPGTYPETVLNWGLSGYQWHWVETRPARPFSFTVTRGKVTVIGRIDFQAKAAVVGESGRGRDFTTEAAVRIDDGSQAKAEVLAEALGRPEADSQHWRDLLEAARSELPAVK